LFSLGRGVGHPEIVEHVAHAIDNGFVRAHACPPRALHCLWSCSAIFSRLRNSSSTFFGVAMPRFDFFWKTCS
jgi:hypothetical protein